MKRYTLVYVDGKMVDYYIDTDDKYGKEIAAVLELATAAGLRTSTRIVETNCFEDVEAIINEFEVSSRENKLDFLHFLTTEDAVNELIRRHNNPMDADRPAIVTEKQVRAAIEKIKRRNN